MTGSNGCFDGFNSNSFLNTDQRFWFISPLEQDCQQIANKGYRIHVMYPDSNPDELPEDDFKRLTYLDNLWIHSLHCN